MEIRKVILIGIDCLRYDRLGIGGYPLQCSPTLDYLAKNGITCENAFAHGNPTQFSYPPIFTSTLPLDFGGYDYGIKKRPLTLSEVFRREGFRTVGFSSSPWLNSFFWYERGFDEYYALYDIQVFWYVISKIYFTYYNALLENKIIKNKTYKALLITFLVDVFDFMIEQCSKSQRELHENKYIDSSRSVQHDYRHLTDLLVGEKRSLMNDPDRYLENNREWLLVTDLNRFLKKMAISKRPIDMYSKVYNKLSNLVDSKGKVILERGKHIFSYGKKGRINQFLRQFAQYNASPLLVDGTYIKNNLLNWIDSHVDDKVFIWTHLLDIHDNSYSPNSFQTIFNHKELLLRKMQLGKQYYGSLTYDLSVKYADLIIKEIIDFLKSRHLLNETLLVIFGDHGMEAGAPYRGGDGVGLFYDEYVKVPLIFWNPNIDHRSVEDVCGLIDLAPTLCDLLGFSKFQEFQGISVCSPELTSRPHVILEHAGHGPCDLTRKPIQLCIRSRRYKYIWREYIPKIKPQNLRKAELYDLERDPYEETNIVSDISYQEIAKELEAIAITRSRKIRDFVDLE